MHNAPYPKPAAPRLVAACLAAFLTLTVLTGIDLLATHEAAAPQMAQQASAPQA